MMETGTVWDADFVRLPQMERRGRSELAPSTPDSGRPLGFRLTVGSEQTRHHSRRYLAHETSGGACSEP